MQQSNAEKARNRAAAADLRESVNVDNPAVQDGTTVLNDAAMDIDVGVMGLEGEVAGLGMDDAGKY